MMPTEQEYAAMAAARRALAETIGALGFDRPPATWSPGEADAVACAVVRAFRTTFWQRAGSDEPPF